MLFTLFITLLGFAFVIRTFDSLIKQSFFLERELTKIGTAVLVVFFALLFLLPRSRFALWTAIFVPIIFSAIAGISLVRRRSVAFRDEISASLAIIALKMKSGRSFRQSLLETTAESEPRLRSKLSEISSRVVFSQQKVSESDPFIGHLLEELTTIDRQPHSSMRRLGVLREKLRVENDFRRRSGQILSRVRAQSNIMTGLYVALALFVAWKFGFATNLRVFSISGLLFFSGSIWIWSAGRRLKWKV